jgi:hypothetical protein
VTLLLFLDPLGIVPDTGITVVVSRESFGGREHVTGTESFLLLEYRLD